MYSARYCVVLIGSIDKMDTLKFELEIENEEPLCENATANSHLFSNYFII